MKNGCFWLLQQNLHSPRFPKKPPNFSFSRYSNSCSFVNHNYDFNSYYQGPNQLSLIVKKLSVQVLSPFFLAEITDSLIFQIMLLILFHFDIEAPNSP